MLREEGAYVIDADEIAREIVKPHKPAWEALRKAFGDQILDREGAIDRKRLSERIFSDPREREHLNRILHPPIRQEILRRLREVEHRDPEAIVVIDAPLLLEVGLHHEVEKVLVVRAKESQQIERLRRRSGLSEELSRKIIGAQMPLEEKLKVADFVIPNEGSLEETRRKAKEVFRTLKRLAKQREKKKAGT
jgi:dephospho-CoA kinase